MPDGSTVDVLAQPLGLGWFYAGTDAIAEAILLLSRMPKGKQAEAVARRRYLGSRAVTESKFAGPHGCFSPTCSVGTVQAAAA